MSNGNVNIGGLEGDLILNTREWTQPAREAMSTLRTLGANVSSALDGINANTRQMAQGMQEMNSRSRQATASVSEGFRQLGQVVSSVASTMRAAVGDVLSTFAGFDKQMRNTDAIAKLTEGQLKDLTRQVRNLRGDLDLTQGSTTLAAGLKEIASSGYSASDSLKILKAAARAADAGDTTAAIIAKGLTPTLKDYGLAADQATVVTDQLFRAIDQGNLSAEDIATQFGSVAPVAAAAGVSLQELSGAFALMSTKGQSASENATQLRSVINHLQAPAVDAAKLLKQYGVETGEAAIRSKGLVGVLQELFQKTGGNKVALKRILDDEGLQAALKLIGTDIGKSFQQAISNQFSADGATEDAFQRQSQGILFKIKQVKAAFEDFKIGIAAGFAPFLGPAADGLKKVANQLVALPDSTKAAIGGFLGLGAVVTSIASGVLLLSPTLITIARYVTDLGGVARIAASAVGTLEGVVASVGAFLAEMAAPIALVVAGVATLAVAWKRDWGGIREFTHDVISDIQDAAKSAAAFIVDNLGPVATQVAQDFREGWPYVQQFFLDTVQAVTELVIPALRKWWEVSRDVFGGVVSVVKTAWGFLGPTIRLMADVVRDMVGIVALALDGDWNAAWNAAVETVANIGPRIQSALEQVKTNIRSGLADIGQAIRNGINDALSGENTNAIDGPEVFRNLQRNLNATGRAINGEIADIQEALQGDRLIAAANAAGGQLGSLLSGSRTAIVAPQIGTGGGVGDVPSIRKGRKGPSAESISADRVASLALRKDGTLFRPGDKAQCANFVREVYREAGVPIGVSAKPIDFRLTMGGGQGSSFANSFFGTDVGKLISSMNELKKGDVLGFRNTYGNFAPGTITHAGVYVGNGKFTHRPTANAPVQTDSLNGYWGKQFATAVRPFALGKGGTGFGQGGVDLQEILAGHAKILEILGKTNNAYETQRNELRKTYTEAMALAKGIGESQQTQNQLKADYLRKVNEVNDAERRENQKVLNEIVVSRLEAEGKLGDAARARIAASAEEEKARWEEQLRLYPQYAEQIKATMKAIDESSARQRGVLDLQQGGQRVQEAGDLQRFQLNDPGAGALINAFPQFRSEVEAAYAALRAYIKDPSEATRAGFDAAIQTIDQLTTKSNEAQQRRLQEVEFERALGQLTKDEAIQRQGEILANWVGGEDSKRQAILQYADLYREYLQQQLDQQGEFNLESVAQLAESLQQAGQLTIQQQGQLIAANQIIQQQRLQDQQNWQGILQNGATAFQGFLTNVLTGQQTLGQAFTQLWKGLATQVIAEITKMIVKATVLLALQKAIGLFSGGIGSIFSGVSSSVTNLLSIPGLPIAHDGGVLSSTGSLQAIPRFHSGSFAGPRFSSSGLRSDEYLAVLQTREAVLNRGQTRALLDGRGQSAPAGRPGGDVYITNHNNISSQMDIDYVNARLGRQAASAFQRVGY